MRSIALIMTLLPITNALQAAGTFNRPLASSVDEWTKRVNEAAVADRIDNQALVDAISQIKAATDFESQQQALLVMIDTMNQQLDDIPAGRLPVYVAPPPTTGALLNLMQTDVSATIDRFTIANDVETRMRLTATELHGRITSAVIEGELTETAMMDIEIVNDAVNYIGDANYHLRNQKMIAASDSIKRLAA